MDQELSTVRAAAKDASDRHVLAAALVINVVMSVIGLIGWRLARSSALLADAFDMLADASGYVVAYHAIGGSAERQRAAARWNGAMLVILGLGVLAEVIHRGFHAVEPGGAWIMTFAALSLLANGIVLRMLSKYRHASEVHLRATWNAVRGSAWSAFDTSNKAPMPRQRSADDE